MILFIKKGFLDYNVIVWRTPKNVCVGGLPKSAIKGDLRMTFQRNPLMQLKYLTFMNQLIKKGEEWLLDEHLRTSAWEATGRKVTRINNEMIPKEKICFDLLTNSLNQFFKKCMEASLENLYVDRGA